MGTDLEIWNATRRFSGLIGRGFGSIVGDIGWSFVAVGSYRGAGRGYWEVFRDIGRYLEGIRGVFGEYLGIIYRIL